ncbi:MAG: cobalt-precorrin 5A hydrolase [Fastidiosipilaceae bacterium]
MLNRQDRFEQTKGRLEPRRIAVFFLTPQGEALSGRLLSDEAGEQFNLTRSTTLEIKKLAELPAVFERYDGLIMIMAMGIVVRKIAPLLRGKEIDPAVVVLDQKARFAISLLSGHLGGANELAREVCAVLGRSCVPIITTATDLEEVTAFDLFAKETGSKIANIAALPTVSGDLVAGRPVGFVSDLEVERDFSEMVIRLDRGQPPPDRIHSYVVFSTRTDLLECSNEDQPTKPSQDLNSNAALRIYPRILFVGIGCKQGVEASYLSDCLDHLLEEIGESPLSIAAVATIDLKGKEPALLTLCQERGIPLITYTARELNRAITSAQALGIDFGESTFVRQTVGVPSVSGPAAWLASEKGDLLVDKRRFSGVTISISRERRLF